VLINSILSSLSIKLSHKWNICTGTHFLSGLIKVKLDFLRLGKFKLGDGSFGRTFG
jgi:hypothetical protein